MRSSSRCSASGPSQRWGLSRTAPSAAWRPGFDQALVGLAPFAKDSGRKRGLRRIRGGRAPVRTALYLSAMNGARFNPVLKTTYDRLRAQGKPPKLAFVALAQKLLTILNAMVRDGSTWREAPTP